VIDAVADSVPAVKHYTAGTHRCVSPEETLARVVPLMPVMGITRIANITGLDVLGVPGVMVCRPNSRSLSVAQGKGATLAAAKASGVMESIEFWHAERIDRPLVLGSMMDLRFTRRLVNLTRMPRLRVSTFDDHHRMMWIEGQDLVSKSSVWVPYECVHTDYRIPLPTGSGCFAISSNGLASGNHVLEAIAHAVCEVIERDATSLWHAGGARARKARRLRLESITDPPCRELLDGFARARVLTAVWDTTSDTGVPSFACEILDDEAHAGQSVGPSAGMGCHTSPAVALSRALTEAAQSRLTRIASSRDDVPRIDYEVFRNSDVLSRLRAEYADGTATIDYAAIAGVQHDTFDEDVAWLIDSLVRIGIEEVVAVDLTHPRLGLPVVRVVIPGLEAPHEAPGYVAGARARAAAQA
jgi:ribosomal protein S12 methylthiotransferase accessory factor